MDFTLKLHQECIERNRKITCHFKKDLEMEEKLHFTEKEAQATDPEISMQQKKRIRDNSWYDRDLGIRTSLQHCPVKALRIWLNGMLASLKSSPSKLNKIHGMIHVLDDLMVKNETIFTLSSLSFSVRGIMTFSTAYQLYSSAFTNKPDVDYFKTGLLSSDFGLPVVLFRWSGELFAVLKSDEIDVPHILSELLHISGNTNANRGQENAGNRRAKFPKELVQQLITSMDSEYDKKVLRGCFAMLLTRSEMENVGIKPDVATKSLEEVEVISIEVANAQIAGQDILKLRLTKQIESLERKQESLNKSINNLNEREGVDLALQDLERKKELIMEQLNYKKAYLEKHEPEMKRRFENSAKRIALDLIKESKIKNRKQGAGAKRKIDEDIELAIAKAIEEKSVAYGRQHDLVLYCNQRVKARDLLGVANYCLKEKDKSEIKSHVTVFNRARPKRLGTGQDKRHIGSGLFCTKKTT